MQKIKLKKSNRKTSVTRKQVKKVVQGAFKKNNLLDKLDDAAKRALSSGY